jgi:hypothetical protein
MVRNSNGPIQLHTGRELSPPNQIEGYPRVSGGCDIVVVSPVIRAPSISVCASRNSPRAFISRRANGDDLLSLWFLKTFRAKATVSA